MRDSDEWNEALMLKRAKRLAKIALKLWPKLDVGAQAVAEAELKDKKRQAAGLTVEDVGGMRAPIKKLYELLEERVLRIDHDISVITTKKNRTFYTLSPFIQAIPRKNKLAVILTLDYQELDANALGYCSDTRDWSFVANVDLSGVYCDLHTKDDFEWLSGLINKAYEETLT
ncbi:hypothetical protein EH243_03815 [Amphritea opalescens]|uniref:Uncharacterized protein n=1 Tax=Amphritea opalescens TaxID=2490544 RepID=A0A430KV47_9GAMM|nr:hypothetical protein [Amphritea opalescens]RTE67338.1 hypothetical protein EH243_03815 [Amphritea opalescens]